ncbi:MAG TPA: 50S ribosomal protein L23 [Bacteroidia bacterium]|jgi:large subunit ribosomal protein L23|nr:50S ribosomal protein L23 [Bacteroidia bacterium]
MSIIVKPLLTEKMTKQAEKFNRYGFAVDIKANKIQIKEAVEKMYNVTVTNIRTMNTAGKVKSRMKRSGIQRSRVGKFKKALIELKQGDAIDFYSNI